uniref:SMP-30/gluconolactonase/LRE family protein n=1 Tax=Nonomuraea pusilla TaxID=46177 RepID=UPI0006E1DA23|nr:SMP-30/gluconolactonase/LRE family protein [Nonomuraea pusilla]
MVVRRFTAAALTGPVSDHGEGPVWHPSWPGPRWVDMLAGDILTLDERSGRVDRRHVGDIAAALRPRTGGGVVVATRRRFVLLDADLHVERRLSPLWTDPDVRMNDGGCDPFGRFYCGSMHDGARPGAGTLYRLDPDGTAGPVLGGLTISNGIDFSPDGRLAYFTDSATRRIDVFGYAETGFAERRRFVQVPVEAGLPDGLTVDSAGNVWVALWGGAAVRRYRASGDLDAVIELPVSQVSACTLGGEGLRTLYVTTSAHGVDPAEEPAAGSLFAARVDVPGKPALGYHG